MEYYNAVACAQDIADCTLGVAALSVLPPDYRIISSLVLLLVTSSDSRHTAAAVCPKREHESLRWRRNNALKMWLVEIIQIEGKRRDATECRIPER